MGSPLLKQGLIFEKRSRYIPKENCYSNLTFDPCSSKQWSYFTVSALFICMDVWCGY